MKLVDCVLQTVDCLRDTLAILAPPLRSLRFIISRPDDGLTAKGAMIFARTAKVFRLCRPKFVAFGEVDSGGLIYMIMTARLQTCPGFI